LFNVGRRRSNRSRQVLDATAILVVAVMIASFPALQTDVRARDTALNAKLRAVNASPGSPNLDLIMDGRLIERDIAFGEGTQFLPVSTGDHEVQFAPTGKGVMAAFVEKKISLDAGEAHELVAVNELSDMDVEDYKINLDAINDGKARVRATNLVPGSDDLKVAVAGGDALFEGLDFKKASDYKDEDPGMYSLEVRKNDEKSALLTAKGVEFQQGSVYDLLILGASDERDLSILTLVTSVSPPCSALLRVGDPEDACVRVVHADAGAPAIDFYANGAQIASGVDIGSASDFVAAPAGEAIAIFATRAGAGSTESIVDQSQTFDAGKAYEIVVAGRVDDESLLVSEIDLAPLQQGQARLRVIDATQDLAEVDLAQKDGEQLFGGVTYMVATDYKVLEDGAIDVSLTSGGNAVATAQSVTLDLKEGMAYDLVLIGSQPDAGLQLSLFATNATARQATVATPIAGAPTGTPKATGTPDG
jgi:Domain of unknown function (DUF4397)